MQYDPVITQERFDTARELSDDVWSDSEVFYEEREGAPLYEIVYSVIEGLATHPAGHNSYEVDESVDSLVWDLVFHDGLVPEGLPDDVKEKFARELSDDVREWSNVVYDEIGDELDEKESMDELRTFIKETMDEVGVPDEA